MSGDDDDAALLAAALANDDAVQDDAVETEELTAPEGDGGDPAENVSEQAASADQGQDKERHYVPLSEHLADRERRQAAERERDELRSHAQRMQQQLQDFQRQLTEMRAPKPEPKSAPDIFEDPDGAINHRLEAVLSPVLQEIQQARIQEKVETERQLEAAGRQYLEMQPGNAAEKLDGAYERIVRRVESGDPGAMASLRAIQAAPPIMRWAKLLEWNRREEVYEATGGDLGKHEQTLQEKLLADPAFLARAVEAAQKQAAARQSPVIVTPNGQAPRRTTSLPSVNSVGAAGHGKQSSDLMNDDRALLSSVYEK